MQSYLVERTQWHLVHFSDPFDLMLVQVLHHGPIFTLSKVPLREKKQTNKKQGVNMNIIRQALDKQAQLYHSHTYYSGYRRLLHIPIHVTFKMSQYHNQVATETQRLQFQSIIISQFDLLLHISVHHWPCSQSNRKNIVIEVWSQIR